MVHSSTSCIVCCVLPHVLCHGHCCFTYCKLCTAACFVPTGIATPYIKILSWALELLCFMHVCCTAVCSVPWALLLHVLHVMLVTLIYIATRARTNVATFECSFIFVTFVSRFFATKHSLILIVSKSCTDYNYVIVSLIHKHLRSLNYHQKWLYLPYL